MIQLVADGYHKMYRLSVPVIILFSNSKSWYNIIWKCYVYSNRLGPTYATRGLHIDFYIKVYFITTTRPIVILLDK